jgi:N6-adenosine-specific RNA methylase IME4
VSAAGPLPSGPFSIIYADAPWKFRLYSEAGSHKSPPYRLMPVDQICAMPIASIAADDAWLFLWATNPNTMDAFRVMDAWGFKFSGVFQTWAKLRANGDGFHFGMGYGSRQNTERVYLGRRGKAKRRDASIPELLIWPVMEHSRKLSIVRSRIVRFAGDVPRVELFARDRPDGWTAWGDQLPPEREARSTCRKSATPAGSTRRSAADQSSA